MSFNASVTSTLPSIRPSNIQEGHDFGDITDILRRRKFTILFYALAFFGLAVVYSLFSTSLYTTTAQILIDPREKRVLENSIAPRDFTSETGIALVESQMKVMTSDTLLLKVVQAERLALDREFGGKQPNPLLAPFRSIAVSLGLIQGGTPEQKALKSLVKTIAVKRADKAFMVDLKVTTKEAEKSARIANSILAIFMENITFSHVSSTKRTTTSLSSRLEEMKLAVKQSEEKVESYKQKHGIVGAAGKLVSEQQLQEMNNQLVLSRAKASELRSRLDQLQRFQRQGGDISSLSEVLQSPTVTALRNQINEATRQEADLLTTLGPRHPQVQSVQKQMLDLKRLLTEDILRVSKTVLGDYERAVANEKSMSQSLDELKKDSLSTGQAFVQLRELEREVDAARNIYNSYLNRARETSEQENIDPSNVRVISQAMVPHEKSWPPTAILLPLSLFLGLGVGTGFALMKEAGDDRIHSKRQIEKITGVPVLGALPSLSRFSSDKWFSAVLDKPNSKFAKIANRIYSLSHASKSSPTRQLLLMLSDQENSVSSTLAMNMALNAAKQGLRVLVIDADFNKRALTSWAGSEHNTGIYDIAAGRATFNQALLHDKRTGVYMLPASSQTGQQGGSLSPNFLRQILADSKIFNLCIIDGGAISQATAGMSLADSVDEIILNVEYGKIKEPRLGELMVALGSSLSKLSGVVMTHAPSTLTKE